MISVRAGGREFKSELFVFDKDGLLFKSGPFWKGLAEARIKALEAVAGPELIPEWVKLMGLSVENGPIGTNVTGVDATRCFAVASPEEEMIVTAGYLALRAGLPWNEAREAGREVFASADGLFDLASSIVPRKGFPEIFRRLRGANIPYGVATSDNRDRTVRSVALFDDPEKLSFIVTPVDVKRGKPDAEMLELISRRTGTDLELITMVGDSFVDMLMAKNAGAVGVGIPEERVIAEKMSAYTDIILSDLDEIIF